jgi:hypothetical protein
MDVFLPQLNTNFIIKAMTISEWTFAMNADNYAGGEDCRDLVPFK